MNEPIAWAFGVTLCLTASAMAQGEPGQTTDGEAIVVEGKTLPPTRGEVAEQARLLSGASNKYDENLARFQVPVCPGVVGLKRAPAEMLVDRIRFNAKRLGVPLAKDKCSANLIVAIVEDGKTFLSDLAGRRPAMFHHMTAADRDALLGDAQPVRVWRNIMTIDAHGVPVPRSRDGKEMLPSVWGYTTRWFVKFHRDIISALVVFDQEAIMGMTLIQLADHATMRGLASMRAADGDEPMATILALFADRDHRAAELTDFDVGYLRSLYWYRPDEAAVSKLLRVRRWAEKARREASKP